MSNRVFCIGQDIFKREFEQVLAKKGMTVVSCKALKDLFNRTEEMPTLFFLDKKLTADPSFSHFAKKYRDIPKIIFFDSGSFKGLSSLLKLPLTYPLSNPSPKELDFVIEKVLHEKKLTAENHDLQNSLINIRKEFSFFEEVNKTLNSSLELNDILNTIMKKAKSLIKAETWSVLLVEEESGELYFEKTGGTKKDKEKMNKSRLKMGEGIAGWVAQEGIPVIVPDVSVDPRFCARIDESINFKTKSLMCVPIQSKGRVLGVFEIVNKTTGEPFTRDDLNLLMRLVDQAALAVERASLYQKMTELSITDDLTKLFNTRYLNRTLEIEITRSNRHKSSLSLIFMDVDHFKVINDNYGHLVGSKLLAEMGQLLIKCLRSMDIVARYGGDEFVIVLPQTAPKHAIQIAERIRRTVEQNIFLKKEGLSLRMTASFGVASYPESAKSKEDLLRLADEAMYRVKYQTRNGVYAIV